MRNESLVRAIRWYLDNKHRMPEPPFDLRPGVTVSGPKFYEALEEAMENQSRDEGLLSDLRDIYRRVELEKQQ